jgi:ubiquinone/menaquinone biosynthesis C-methylase UbiE
VSEGLEYAGLKAQSWDALRGDTSDWADRAFYLDLIEERGQPVLDVGCGTGRLLLDFLAIGIDIDGVELSPDMVDILRAKAGAAGIQVEDRVTVAAMETMELPRRYRVILVPSSSFQLLTDPTAAAAAMRQFRNQLAPNGTLAMPWIDISQDYPGGADDRRTTETTEPDGTVLRLTYHGWFDAATGLEHTDERFVRLIDGTVVEDERIVRSPATRQYDRESIQRLHEAAGFDEVEWLSGFTRGAAKPDDRIVTTLARRPG